MVTTDDQVDAIFADARTLYADALEMLDMGKLRTRRRRPGKPPSGPPTP